MPKIFQFLDKEIKPVSLKCGHTFCKECINGSKGIFADKQKANCPNCRKPSLTEELRQIYFS